MRHVRSLQFDALEGRQLLSHSGATAATSATGYTPLVLDGTLMVDQKAAQSNMNADETMTTTAPVAGRLGTLGKVTGSWIETTNTLGAVENPDILRLHDSKGSLIILFNNTNTGKPTVISKGTSYFQHVQDLYVGTRAFAQAAENGTIQVVTSAKQQSVTSLVLTSTNNQ
jgi:hypothetical protein